VLTVTYGPRWHLLSQVLRAVSSEPLVKRVIIVDNAASPPVRKSLEQTPALVQGPRIDVIALDRNVGSAAAFARAIELARGLPDITHVLLLDDDNVPAAGSIQQLVELSSKNGAERGAVVSALRVGRQEYEELLYHRKPQQIRANSFLGFHLAELPQKLLKSRRVKKISAVTDVRVRELVVAPYGGLLIPMHWLRTTDLPRSDLVLYGDDHEYTLRMRRAGARLLLTNAAKVHDVDASWSNTSHGNSWVSVDAPAWRAYYACRNRMYLEDEFVLSSWIYNSNRVAYMGVLLALALRQTGSLRQTRRVMQPLIDAITDARRGVTGLRPPYALPQGANERPG
jgi:GT2 family glycosyltransferase